MLFKPKSVTLDPMIRLEFVDELKFRELAAEYFSWLVEVRVSTQEADAYYAQYDEEIIKIVVENNTYGNKFETLVRWPTNFHDEWTEIKFSLEGYGDIGVEAECIRDAITSNQRVLIKYLRYADDPKLIAERKKRELLRRGVSSKRIFIVHGHDHELVSQVSQFLKNLQLEPIVLHEQPNRGKTIIEKFEEQAEVGFAVVLLTPDDLAAPKTSTADDRTLVPRARQNVVLELGYFIAKLGRDRVCALRKGDIEMPSDILGVVYTHIDDLGRWRVELAKELSAAGYAIDLRQI